MCSQLVLINKSAFLYESLNSNTSPVIKSTSRGAEYQTFVEEYAAKLEDNRLTHQEVAYALKVSRSVVTKMYAAYLEDKKTFEAQEDWKIAKATVKSLDDFKKFRDKYFKTETGQRQRQIYRLKRRLRQRQRDRDSETETVKQRQ